MKKTLTGLFLACGIFSHSQDARLCVQTGHSSAVTAVSYNYTGELVASASSDNKVVVWHVESGKQFANFTSHKSVVTDLVFHPRMNKLYSVGMDSTLKAWDIATNQLDTSIKFNYPLGCISISKDGSMLAVGGEQLTILEPYYFGRKKLAISALNLFTSVAFSPNGEWVFVGGRTEKKALLLHIPSHEIRQVEYTAINDAVFSENDSSVFIATQNGQIIESNFYLKTANSTATKNELNSYNSIGLTKKHLIGVTDEGQVELFNRATWERAKGFEGHLQGITSVIVGADQRHIITGGADKRLILWDIDKEEMVRTYESNSFRINHIAFTESGDELVIGFANGYIRKSNLINNGSISNRLRINQVMIEAGWEYHLIEIKKQTADEIIFDAVLTRKSATRETGYDLLRNMTLTWDLNSNELHVMEENEPSELVVTYESLSRQGIWNDETFFVNDDLLTQRNTTHTAAVRNNRLILEMADGKLVYDIAMNHSDRITSVSINEKYNFVATASWDGMIKFWSMSDGKLLATYGAFNGSDFIYLTRDNYYFASKGALDNIGFVIGDQIYAFDQFDLLYNRPDLVFANLPYVDEKTVANYNLAYKKRLSKLGLTESDLKISTDIPTLEVELDNTTITYDGWVRYSVVADAKKNLLSSFHVLVNGVPEFTKSGMALKGNYFQRKDSIYLNPGINHIQFYVTNHNGGSSLKRTFEINNRGKVVTPDLYLITIGCSKYKQEQYNLNYAQKDALDIEKFFKKNRAFDDVYSEVLTNELVTLDKVKALKEFLSEVRENDVVLLFIAGHGVLDMNLDYYLAAHDMDFSRPQDRGIPITFFEDLLDNIRSRKKLMLIDACHSGEIDKSEVSIDTTTVIEEGADISFRAVGASVKNINDVNSFELSRIVFADVRESNGSTVISSAGGGEYAFEGDEWQNGVFTYVLLHGLKSKEADLNRDGEVMISEMQVYLAYEVNRLTGGKQTPTSRVENLINDFQID